MLLQSSNIITLAEKLGNALLEKKLKLVTAESCTGGGLSYAITHIPGSSQWFERGFVTYSNESKQELLGVFNLEKYGAVSSQAAYEMAEGALQHSHADLAISITGIAGPDGDSANKPIGLVWFGFAGKQFQTKTIMENFSGNRQEIREQSIAFALANLLSIL